MKDNMKCDIKNDIWLSTIRNMSGLEVIDHRLWYKISNTLRKDIEDAADAFGYRLWEEVYEIP